VVAALADAGVGVHRQLLLILLVLAIHKRAAARLSRGGVQDAHGRRARVAPAAAAAAAGVVIAAGRARGEGSGVAAAARAAGVCGLSGSLRGGRRHLKPAAAARQRVNELVNVD
jgi:hypothetical protein